MSFLGLDREERAIHREQDNERRKKARDPDASASERMEELRALAFAYDMTLED